MKPFNNGFRFATSGCFSGEAWPHWRKIGEIAFNGRDDNGDHGGLKRTNLRPGRRSEAG
jgi:hypothetical protein